MWPSVVEFFNNYQFSTLLFIALAAFSTALFHSVSGFAGGLILSILLVPILGVKAVIPVVSIALIISNGSRAWLFRRAVNWQIYRAIMITAIPGFVLGATIYVYLPVAAIAILLGIFLILSVPLRRFFKQRNFTVGLRGLTAVGGGFGILAGTVIGAGLVLGPFLLGAGVFGEALVGMVAVIGLTSNITKSLVFSSFELLTLSWFVAGILVGICTIPGGIVGRWIVRNTSLRLHTLLVESMIICGGCYFIYQGLVPIQ